MKKITFLLIVLIYMSIFSISCKSSGVVKDTETPTSTNTFVPTETAIVILSKIAINTPTATFTPSQTATSTQTPTPLSKDLSETHPTGEIRRALVSPNGKFVVFTTSTDMYIYELEEFKIIRFIETDSEIGKIAISPDSQIIAIGTQDKMLVHSLNNGDLITTINKSVTNMAFSPDGQKIAIGMGSWKWCRGGASLELWQVSNWSLLQALPLSNQLDCISGLVFSPSGNFLAASAFEVLIWEIDESSSVLKARSWGCDVFEGRLAFSPNEKTLIAGTQADSGLNKICLIRLEDGETLGVLDKANKSDNSCAAQVLISPDGQFMASNLDGEVTIWQVGEWKQIQSLDVEGNCAQLSGWLPDGQTLTFLLPDSSLQFYSTQTEKIIRSVNLTNP